MDEHLKLVVFRLDEQRYALPLATIERIVRAAEVTVWPKTPPVVLGVINVGGRVLPVLNLRQRFGLPEREIHVCDHFIIAETGQRTVVLAVDEVLRVTECAASQIVDPGQIVEGLDHIQGVMRLDDGLVLIQQLEKVLSLDEQFALDEALRTELAHD